MPDQPGSEGSLLPASRSPDESAADVAVGLDGAPRASSEEPPTLADSLDRSTAARAKFRYVYVTLAVVLLVAIGAFAGLVLQGGSEGEVAWSPFEPTQQGILGVQEIAEYVESRYLFTDGEPLVSVNGTRLSLQDEPIALIAIQRFDNGAEAQLLLESESSVEFGLCGDPAAQCSITKGEASRERLRLLSRESLELALYTFHYIEEVDSVVAFLPPALGQEPIWALLFRRETLADALAVPLETTLAAEVPAPEAITEQEILIIDGLTEPNRLQYAFEQLDDGRPVLVLNEP